MALLVGQDRDHLRWFVGHEGIWAHPIAFNGGVAAKIQVIVMELDACAAILAEPFLLVGTAVAIVVAQRDNATRSILLVADCNVEVAVRCHYEVTGGAEAVRNHHGAEALRQCDTAVIRIARGKP